jgi:hypothetical protein
MLNRNGEDERLPDAAGTEYEDRNDEVARRAYDLYQARGGEHGRDLDDWTQAEREVRGGSTGEGTSVGVLSAASAVDR